MTEPPTVEILYFEGCSNYQAARELVERIAAEEGIAPSIGLVEVTSIEDAGAQRFLGSPSIRVDGHDVEPGADERETFVLACRVYRTPSGSSGRPATSGYGRRCASGNRGVLPGIPHGGAARRSRISRGLVRSANCHSWIAHARFSSVSAAPSSARCSSRASSVRAYARAHTPTRRARVELPARRPSRRPSAGVVDERQEERRENRQQQEHSGRCSHDVRSEVRALVEPEPSLP